MTQTSCETLWGPLAHMPTLLAAERTVITGGHGSELATSDRRTLLNPTADPWHANIGDSRPEIAGAAAEQLTRLETYQSFLGPGQPTVHRR